MAIASSNYKLLSRDDQSARPINGSTETLHYSVLSDASRQFHGYAVAQRHLGLPRKASLLDDFDDAVAHHLEFGLRKAMVVEQRIHRSEPTQQERP